MEDASIDPSTQILAAAHSINTTEPQVRRLRIAVLGPGPSSPGRAKREQIGDALREDGHDSFFPEDVGNIGMALVDPVALDSEQEMLEKDDVHLVIMLVTGSARGVEAEYIQFRRVPRIRDKTALLYPKVYYQPDDHIAANTARDYQMRPLYSPEEMRDCDVVGECRTLAHQVAQGRRWGAPPSFYEPSS